MANLQCSRLRVQELYEYIRYKQKYCKQNLEVTWRKACLSVEFLGGVSRHVEPGNGHRARVECGGQIGAHRLPDDAHRAVLQPPRAHKVLGREHCSRRTVRSRAYEKSTATIS